MRTITYIESEVAESVRFGYTDDTGKFVEIEGISEEEMAEAARNLKTSPEMLLAICDSFECLRTALHNDLVDIWKRIENQTEA